MYFYNYYRYYNALLGRYTSLDPLDGNSYIYTLNPINTFDNYGLYVIVPGNLGPILK